MEHSSPTTPCRTLVISGRVQGVWYRASTQRKAQELGLSGWVENQPDGTVLVLVSGPHPKVEALIDWCRQGPPGARVERVEIGECPEPAAHQATDGFVIRRR
ncbi:MAG: acylphosphatase [Magnetococcales bacterium]|nr:acylphosphatase [Magnetococcales bacterium]